MIDKENNRRYLSDNRLKEIETELRLKLPELEREIKLLEKSKEVRPETYYLEFTI